MFLLHPCIYLSGAESIKLFFLGVTFDFNSEGLGGSIVFVNRCACCHEPHKLVGLDCAAFRLQHSYLETFRFIGKGDIPVSRILCILMESDSRSVLNLQQLCKCEVQLDDTAASEDHEGLGCSLLLRLDVRGILCCVGDESHCSDVLVCQSFLLCTRSVRTVLVRDGRRA